jgi:2-keto-4-pentenoate hydratase
MLNKDQLAAVSKILHDHWRAGTKFAGLDASCSTIPRIALAWLANELRGLGVTLGAGEVVTTGTCHAPLPIQSGDFLQADFPSLGKVSVRFE